MAIPGGSNVEQKHENHNSNPVENPGKSSFEKFIPFLKLKSKQGNMDAVRTLFLHFNISNPLQSKKKTNVQLYQELKNLGFLDTNNQLRKSIFRLAHTETTRNSFRKSVEALLLKEFRKRNTESHSNDKGFSFSSDHIRSSKKNRPRVILPIPNGDEISLQLPSFLSSKI